ncbi:MAG: universal stress protein [Chromatiaceae bacterium]
MKILLPVDGSESATRAVEHVLKMTHQEAPPDIHLLHVRPPIESWEVRRFLTAEEIGAMQRHEGEEELRACRHLLDASGIPYHFEVLAGDGQVAAAITHYAEAHDCDLIVMGTHGRTGLTHLLMGSVTTDVIHGTKVPVTLVK